MALSYKNDENEDERLSPYSDDARDLYHQEQSAYDREFDDIAQNFDDTADDSQENANIDKQNTKNIDNAKEKETEGGWHNSVGTNSGSDGKKGDIKGFLKKKGPLGVIIALFMGGGLLGGGFFSSIGLINFKELAVQKLDSMTSVLEARSDQALGLQFFSEDITTNSCAIKVKCRFKGVSERQMQRLEIQGAQLVDANGKRVTKNPITGRYTGGKKLILPNKEAVDATQFKAAIRDKGYSDLRDITRSVFAPRWLSWNDQISKDIRAKKRLVTNPQWGEEGDPKEANKEIAKAVVGESTGAATTQDNTQYTTNENGEKVPVEKDAGAAGLDFGDDAQNINDEADKLKAEAATGADVATLPDDTASAATLPEYEGKYSAAKGFKSILDFANPLNFFSGMCTSYQLINIMLVATHTIMLANAMRYASQFLSTADKMKAGDATSDDVEKAMNILQKENKSGEAFGESFTYNYVAYGKVTDIPLGSSANGNDVVRTLNTTVNTVNHSLGGEATVKGACNILTNPFVQGGLALTSFIPGGGQIANAVSKLAVKGGMAATKKLIAEKVSGIVAKNLTKDALKSASRTAGRELYQMAKSPAFAMFLGGYLLERYGVPYLAQMIAGTEFVGADGMKAADGIGNGLDATNSVTAQSRALTPLTKDEYAAFNEFNKTSTATYVADMQKQTDPLDFNSPYSTGSQMASAFYPLVSSLNIFSQPSNFFSLPSRILGSLSPGQFLANTALADQVDTQAELNYCQDEYLQSHNLATSPYCNVKYGFNDPAMLTQTDNDQVIDWMYSHNQIDGDGNPVADSDFEDFKSTCVDNTDNKFISDLGEDDEHIDPKCYGDKNKTIEYKMYRLYLIDSMPELVS